MRASLAFPVWAALCGAALANPTSYGTGCAGSGGFVPVWSSVGYPNEGGTLYLNLSKGLGSANAFVFLGLTQGSLPIGYGCSLLVNPLLPFIGGPLPLTAGGPGSGYFHAELQIPFGTAGATFTSQVFVADSGVPAGFSNSNGVDVKILPVPATHLVINEVDYDQAGVDTNEYIEILNPTASAVSLSGLQLRLVDGATNAEYLSYDLSPGGTLGPGQYLVVSSSTLASSVPASAVKLLFASGVDNIHNGAPDGIALVDTNSATLIDALSYEGSIIAVTLAGIGTVSLVEGSAYLGGDSGIAPMMSLNRLPNGSDTDNAAVDWAFSLTPTAGYANFP